MDIVYICRAGENEELKYSLRSLKNIPHDSVYLFGGKPDWCSATCVTTPQSGSKYDNAFNSLRTVCESESVSDDFILMNDDFFAMRSMDSVGTYHRGEMVTVYGEYRSQHPLAIYTNNMFRTLKLLFSKGYEHPLSYELHIPMVINKKKMLDILELCDGDTGLQMRSLYGNIYSIGGEEIEDVKVYGPTTRIPSGSWLSTWDPSFNFIKPILDAAFPHPSEWE